MGTNQDVVRLGHLRDIRVAGSDLAFRFEQHAQFSRLVVEEFASRLGFGAWEDTRTHWAIKDGDIPSDMLRKVTTSFVYEIVLSFAGEDRVYVEKVAEYLKANGVNVFYDRYEKANLWGTGGAD